MKTLALAVSLSGIAVHAALAAAPARRSPELFCHRTANEDVPENTLESLDQATLSGCDVVEIDVRRTLDGRLVLNHDGFLERLTDGAGTVETSFYGELAISDAGSWMGSRFAGLHVATLDDALRLARQAGVRLILDIKTPGIGAEVLQALAREGMLERVLFNGEWNDIKRLRPEAHDAGYQAMWVRAGVTSEEVQSLHAQGKTVIANFSDSTQELALEAMRAAVSAGVDAINVDYPRLGAEAVGRPVESTLRRLIQQASSGDAPSRCEAVLTLARFNGFPALQRYFAAWLLDPMAQVSRSAALALVQARPTPSLDLFRDALHSANVSSRANGAWALGRMRDDRSAARLALLQPLLADGDPRVRAEAYLAVSRVQGPLPAAALQKGLVDADGHVRGAAALALATHDPQHAANLIAEQLRRKMASEDSLYKLYIARTPRTLTPEEIASVTASYQCQMQMMKSLALLRDRDSTRALEEQAFRAGEDFSQMNGVVAGFNLWDRIAAGPARAIEALGSDDAKVADRAEWMLLQVGDTVRSALKEAFTLSRGQVRVRLERILALQEHAALR